MNFKAEKTKLASISHTCWWCGVLAGGGWMLEDPNRTHARVQHGIPSNDATATVTASKAVAPGRCSEC